MLDLQVINGLYIIHRNVSLLARNRVEYIHLKIMNLSNISLTSLVSLLNQRQDPRSLNLLVMDSSLPMVLIGFVIDVS